LVADADLRYEAISDLFQRKHRLQFPSQYVGLKPPAKSLARLTLPVKALFHLETVAKLLKSPERIFADFSNAC
jgi:hypothetical protein